MKKTTLIRCALALCGLYPLVAGSSASAGITFAFSPALDGGVDVVGSGTGVFDRTLGSITSDDWDVQNFETNFIGVLDGATIGADTVSGSFTNVTTSTTVDIIEFEIDNDFGTSSDNDLDWDTSAEITFNLNDEMTFSMNAHFPPPPGAGTLAISELVIGTHIDVGHTQGAGIAEESFGITTVIVVPEPNTILLSIACFTAVGVMRRLR